MFYIFRQTDECMPYVNLPGDLWAKGEDFPHYRQIYDWCTIMYVYLYLLVCGMLLFNYSIALIVNSYSDFLLNKEREFMQQKWDNIIKKQSERAKFNYKLGNGKDMCPQTIIFRYRKLSVKEKNKREKYRANGLEIDLPAKIENVKDSIKADL